MLELSDSILIKASAEKVFNILIKIFSDEKNYKSWHRDHIRSFWKKGRAFEKGAVFTAEEYLHGKPHKLKFVLSDIKRNELIEFKFDFPFSIICPKGSFLITTKGDASEFKSRLFFRSGNLLKKITKMRLKALEKHMREESLNLKEIAEKNLI